MSEPGPERDAVFDELDRILAPGREGRSYLVSEETPEGPVYFRVGPGGERTQVLPPLGTPPPRRKAREVRLPGALRAAFYVGAGFALAEAVRGSGAFGGNLPLGLYLLLVAVWPFVLAGGALVLGGLALWRLLATPV